MMGPPACPTCGATQVALFNVSWYCPKDHSAPTETRYLITRYTMNSLEQWDFVLVLAGGRIPTWATHVRTVSDAHETVDTAVHTYTTGLKKFEGTDVSLATWVVKDGINVSGYRMLAAREVP